VLSGFPHQKLHSGVLWQLTIREDHGGFGAIMEAERPPQCGAAFWGGENYERENGVSWWDEMSPTLLVSNRTTYFYNHFMLSCQIRSLLVPCAQVICTEKIPSPYESVLEFKLHHHHLRTL